MSTAPLSPREAEQSSNGASITDSARLRIFTAVALLLSFTDLVRQFTLSSRTSALFTDAYETMVAALSAIGCMIAVRRSLKHSKARWLLVTAYFAFLSLADLHDFVVGLFPSYTGGLGSALEWIGWYTYLPLALLVFFPLDDDERPVWSWLTVLDFAQVALITGIAYFYYIYVPHFIAHNDWRAALRLFSPEVSRNLLLSGGLLLRAALDSRNTRFYLRVGGLFTAMSIISITFQGNLHYIGNVGRPLCFMVLGILAATWRDEAPDSNAAKTRLPGWIFSCFPIMGPLAALSLAENVPANYASWMKIAIVVSILIYVARACTAEYQRRNLALEARRSSDQIRSIVETAEEGIWTIGPDRTIRYLNEKMASMLGFSREEMLGRPVEEFIDPALRGSVAQTIERRRQGIHERYEYTLRRKDGSPLYVTVGASPILDEHGNYTGALGMVADISERRRAEESLRDSEARFRTTFETSGIGMALLDMQRRIIQCNPALVRILGYSEEELRSLESAVATHPLDRNLDAVLFTQLIAGEREKYEIEKRYVRKDGQTIWGQLIVSLIRDKDGNPKYTVGMVQDITERKRAEQALRESETRFRTTFETSGIGMALVDLNGRAVESNLALRKILGYSDVELSAMALWDFTHPEDQELTVRCFQELIAGEREKYEIEKRYVAKDGSTIWGNVTVSLLRDESGNCRYAVVMVQDIRERKRAEESLRHQNQYLTALQEITLALVSQFDSERLLHSLLEHAMRLMQTQIGYIALIEPGATHLSPTITMGGPVELRFSVRPGEGVSGMVWKTGKPLVVHDYDLWSNRLTGYNIDLVRAAAGIPLLSGSRVLGVLVVAYDRTSTQTFSEEALERLNQFGRLASIALENAQLYSTVQKELAERRRAEEALRASEEKFAKAFEASPDCIAIGDLATREILEINESFERLTGYSRDLIIGRTVASLGVFIDGDPLEEAFKILRDKGSLRDIEFQIRRKSGELAQVVASAELITIGGRQCYVFVNRDVTDKKLAEEALRRTEASYRDLVETANDIIFTVDADGYCRSMNRVGLEVTGHLGDDPHEINLLQLVVPEHVQMTWTQLQRVMNGESVAPFELDIVNKHGRRLTLELGVRPIVERRKTNAGRNPFTGRDGRDQDGKVRSTRAVLPKFAPLEAHRFGSSRAIGAHGIARDITARKELEMQLRQAQKMEGMGRLAGGIAHDFNNLLAVIMGYSEVLEDKVATDPSLRKSVDAIQSAGKRAASLTSQLLAFSRRQALQPKVLNLNSVIVDTEKMLGRLIGEDVEAIADLDSALGQVKADSGQMFQIIMNLAVNARDAMPNGGKFMIGTKNVVVQEEVLCRGVPVRPGRYVALSVSDTGIGMDKATLERIFEPFFTTKAEGKGTGLGLATVFGIVEQSGGYVFVESELGKGTTFRIYLPRIDEEVQAPKIPSVTSELSSASETILLVEDDTTLRELIAETLRKNGYKVLVAVNGVDAVSISEKFDKAIPLIITDVVMPQMSGPELAQMIRGSRPETRVLYMSGYTDDKLQSVHTLDPKTPLIQKPFRLRDLTAKVREVLGHADVQAASSHSAAATSANA